MGQKEVKINSIEGHFQFQNISTKEKLIQVVFKDINRIYGVNVNISNMNKIQSILNKFFCFPIELKINIVEQITDNFQIVLSIENSENYIVDIDIIEIKHNKIEHQSFK